MNRSWTIKELSQDSRRAYREVQACVALQRAVGWGEESVPSHVLRADAMHLALPEVELGFVLVAEQDDGNIVGFCRVTYTGTAGEMYLHEVVVLPEVQSSGLGYALMHEIRKHCLERGASQLLFTFDPMDKRNLFFYLQKCGAVAIRLLRDFYDVHATPPPSFSFLAQWKFDRPTLKPAETFSWTFPARPTFEQTQFVYHLPSFPSRLQDAQRGIWIELLHEILNQQNYQLVGLPDPEGKAYLFHRPPGEGLEA